MRRKSRAATYALVGIACTVAVSWVAAWREDPSPWSPSFRPSVATIDGDRLWVVDVNGGLANTWVLSIVLPPGLTSSSNFESPHAPEEILPHWADERREDQMADVSTVHHASGWPFRAMRFHATRRPPDDEHTLTGGWRIRRKGAAPQAYGAIRWIPFPDSVILPLRPIIPGFAADAAIRRFIRRRRGVCPRCGYPIGASPLCTECGETVRPAAAS